MQAQPSENTSRSLEEQNAHDLMRFCLAIINMPQLNKDQKAGYMAAVANIHPASCLYHLQVEDAVALFKRLL